MLLIGHLDRTIWTVTCSIHLKIYDNPAIPLVNIAAPCSIWLWVDTWSVDMGSYIYKSLVLPVHAIQTEWICMYVNRYAF